MNASGSEISVTSYVDPIVESLNDHTRKLLLKNVSRHDPLSPDEAQVQFPSLYTLINELHSVYLILFVQWYSFRS
jgi:hypothetical protein